MGLAAAVAALLPAAPVAAHAGLESSTPAASSVLEVSPDNIVLQFDEAIEAPLASIQLFDASAATIRIGTPSAAPGDETVVLASLPTLDEGLYAVVWRVASVDGHVVEGAFGFQIGTAGSGTASSDGASLVDRVIDGVGADEAVGRAATVARFLGFIGVVLVIGGGLWIAAWTPVGEVNSTRRGRGLLLTGWIALVLGTAASFGLYAAAAIGGSLGDAWSAGAWDRVLGTNTATMLLLRLGLAMALGAVALGRGARATTWWKGTAIVVAMAIIATFPAAGHPSATSPRSLWTLNDGAHLGAIAVWLGGLLVLGVSAVDHLRDNDVRLRSCVQQFSRTATVMVPLIVLTGVAQTWRLAGGLGHVTTTDWGRTLLVKVAVVSVLLAIGAVSRWLLVNDGLGSIRRLVVVEAGLGVIVLGLAASLVSLPPRPVAESKIFSASLAQAGTIVDITITPGRVGGNDIHVVVTPAGGSLQPVTAVLARMALPERELPNVPVALAADGSNHYSGTVTLAVGGSWTLEVIVEVTAGNSLLLSTEVLIPDA